MRCPRSVHIGLTSWCASSAWVKLQRCADLMWAIHAGLVVALLH